MNSSSLPNRVSPGVPASRSSRAARSVRTKQSAWRFSSWPGFKLRYRDTVYRIAILRDESGSVEHSDHVIPLVDDRLEHHVEAKIRARV
jgi:hypothetical protein